MRYESVKLRPSRIADFARVLTALLYCVVLDIVVMCMYGRDFAFDCL